MAFDLRPMGYSLPEARSLVSALGKAGSDFYLNVQLWLDTAYPGLLAAVLMMAFHKLASGPFAWLLEAGAVLTALFDYLENHAIAEMLRAGPDTLTEVMVESASNWTLLKSASSTLIFSALLFLLLRFAWHWFRHSKSQ